MTTSDTPSHRSSSSGLVPAWVATASAVVAAVVVAAAPKGATGQGASSDGAPVDASGSPLRAVVEKYSQLPKIKAFVDRMQKVDAVEQRLLAAMETGDAAALDAILGDVAGKAPPPPSPTFAAAAEIYFTYRETFRMPLAAPDLPAPDVQVLRTGYDAHLQAAVERVATQGRRLAALDPRGREGHAALCFVLPFLQVADAAWSKQTVDAMPSWLHEPGVLPALQRAAIHLRRPRTAYIFHRYGRPGETGPATPDDADRYRAYLRSVAVSQERAGHLSHAVVFMRAALAAGQGRRDTEQRDLWFELARLYDTAGHPQLAAEQMQQMTAQEGLDPDNRAPLLYLKYLFGAGDDDRIVAATDPDAGTTDGTAMPTPEMLFLRWAALRRQERYGEAHALAQAFLAAHGEHHLAADILFGEAMSALAEGDHPRALDHLEVIAVRFPDAPVMEKVGRMLKSLREDGGDGD